MQETTHASPKRSLQELKSVIFMGLLPLIVYWIVENYWGVKAGVIAAFVFAVIEIIYEYKTTGKPHLITWLSNGLVIIMGVASLYLNDGIWFKLQPAVLEIIGAGFFFLTNLFGKPLVVEMMKKMNPDNQALKHQFFIKYLSGMNFRFGFILLLHAILTGYAALKLSTSTWIFIKGILLFVFFGFLFVFEFFYSRHIVQKQSVPRT